MKPPANKAYWRNIAQQVDDPELREWLQAGDDSHEGPNGMSRRNFLSLMGASLALAGLAGCRRPVEKIVPYVIKPEEITPGIPQYYATSMPLADEAGALVVESNEGRPTHVAGNRLNRATGGAASVWATASILGLYDPDRSQLVTHNGVPASPADFAAAWRELHARFSETGGQGLAVLSEAYASPTRHRLARDFKAAFPQALWAVYEPVSDENINRGIELLTGQALSVVPDFSQARVVLSLEADFLGSESRAQANTLAFADGRRVTTEHDTMNRLYLVESTLSQTAVLADHRLTIASGRIGAFLGALYHQLNDLGLALPVMAGLREYQRHDFDTHWLNALAHDLLNNRGHSLVLAGRRQPPVVHALTAALNHALGNTGRTVDYGVNPHSESSNTNALTGLTAALERDEVNTLVMVGGNPAYNAPADLNFSAALGHAEHTIHLSPYNDETSRLTEWHIPQLHYLESWADVTSLEGFSGVIQPLIAPLYEGRSPGELLSLLATGEEHSGHDLVRDTWRRRLEGANFEAGWRRLLHDGLQTTGAKAADFRPGYTSLQRELAAGALFDAGGGDGLELVFQVSPAVHDGRFANLGWLQELPDPVTKITWDNATLLSATTARRLGVHNNELVYLSLNGRHLTVPAWIVPGQAEGTVTLALGYGRAAAGRVGTGVGANAYQLRSSGEPGFASGLTVRPLGRFHKLACVQDHHGLDEETLAAEGIQERLPQIVREADLEEYRQHPEFAGERVEHPPLKSLWEDHRYDEGHQWAMAIDLNVCTGCGACTVACQSENNIPIVGRKEVLNGREMHWIRVDRYYTGNADNPKVVTQPVACNHCEMAPCESVCPVAATTHDDEGLNTMAYNRCVGTRYCANNCPYKVRRFNFYNFTKDLPEIVRLVMNPDVTVRSRGVMEKCTYCVQRINGGKMAAKREGRELRDGDITTACQQACPSQAIVFGDGNDPDSAIARLKLRDRNYDLLGELNLRPRTSYLAKLRNPNPRLEGAG